MYLVAIFITLFFGMITGAGIYSNLITDECERRNNVYHCTLIAVPATPPTDKE